MTKLTNESPIGDIIARFKELSGSTSDDKTIAKRGKAKLLARIEELEKIEAQAAVDHEGEAPPEAKAEQTIEQIITDAHADQLLGKVPQMEDEPEGPSEAEQEAQDRMTIANAHEPKAEKPKKAKREKKPKKEKKAKGPVIRAEAEKLLLKVVSHDKDKRAFGMPYEDILAELGKIFPGAKTTVACLRWYAVHMRERGEKVPARPRATKQAEAA